MFTNAPGVDELRQFMSDFGLIIPDLPSLRYQPKCTPNKREPDIFRTGYQPKWTSRSKLSLRGRVENQVKLIECVNTPLRVYEHSKVKSHTTTLYTLTMCHRIIYYDT